MEKSISKNRVAAVRSYLDGIGKSITQVQGYEVVARAQGFENKHTMAASQSTATGPATPAPAAMQSIHGQSMITDSDGNMCRFFELATQPMTVAELEAAHWQLVAVLPVPTELVSDIDALNDYASKTLTGIDYALQDIRYRVFPYFYDEDHVAMQVRGHIPNPEELFGEAAVAENVTSNGKALMPKQDLARLMQLLQRAIDQKVTWYMTLSDDVPHAHRVVWEGDDDGVLMLSKLYAIKEAADRGADYEDDEVSISFADALSALVFEHIDTVTQAWEDDGGFLHVSDLAYGRRVSENAWEFTTESGKTWRLGFNYAETCLTTTPVEGEENVRFRASYALTDTSGDDTFYFSAADVMPHNLLSSWVSMDEAEQDSLAEDYACFAIKKQHGVDSLAHIDVSRVQS